MLELKKYTRAEIAEILGTQSRQGIRRKLDNYGVRYYIEGRGNNFTLTITEITDPFKVFCILDLGYSAQCDFHKMLYFFYYYFNDTEFMAMPDEVKEHRLDEKNTHISRGTIAHWIEKLERQELIKRKGSDYIYYFAFGNTQIMTDEKTYKKAWHEYWLDKDEGYDSEDAIGHMIIEYGGVARKQAIPDINGIYLDKINTFTSIIAESIEKDAKVLSRTVITDNI